MRYDRSYAPSSRVDILLRTVDGQHELVVREDDFVLFELVLSEVDAEYVAAKFAEHQVEG